MNRLNKILIVVAIIIIVFVGIFLWQKSASKQMPQQIRITRIDTQDVPAALSGKWVLIK